jgi:hypothetical protein
MIGNLTMTMNTDRKYLLLITAVWLVMVVTVNPTGNFPLNDDWVYAESVRILVDEKRFVFPDWSAPNYVAHAIWGWLFSLVFGFSFTVLRFSVLVLGLIGVISAFKLSKEIGVPSAAAVLGALVLVVNPIYFASSNTFMTDVPFFAFSALSLLFLTRAINDDNGYHIALGTVAAGLALLTRQLGLAIPIAYALAYLVGRELSQRTIVRAFFPLFICITLQLLFNAWLNMQAQMPSIYGHRIDQINHMLSLPILNITKLIVYRFAIISLYLSLFISPVLLVAIFFRYAKITITQITLFAIATLLAWIILGILNSGHIGVRWPLIGNILGEYGIEPALGYYEIYISEATKPLVKTFWKLIGALSVGFTGVMFFSLVTGLHDVWLTYRNKHFFHARIVILFFGVTIINCMPLLVLEHVFDRYLLLPILTLMQAIFLFIKWKTGEGKLRRSRNAIIIAGLVFAGTLTTMVTHDYLTRNRVRWAALNDLVHVKRVSPTKIDGGFEFNGMYLYTNGESRPGSKGWWVVDNEYIISYTPNFWTTPYRPGDEEKRYEVEARYSVDTYLSISPKSIFILHRP